MLLILVSFGIITLLAPFHLYAGKLYYLLIRRKLHGDFLPLLIDEFRSIGLVTPESNLSWGFVANNFE